MRHLGIEKAHIVGHSNSGNLVLQLALDFPETVHSLVVAEPALMAVPSAQNARAFLGAAMQQYRAGDKAGGERRETTSRDGSQCALLQFARRCRIRRLRHNAVST